MTAHIDRRWRRPRDNIQTLMAEFSLTREFGIETRKALRLLVIETMRTINGGGEFIGVEFVTKIPPEIISLTTHFREPERIMSAAWVVEYDHSESILMVEKFSEASEYGVPEDVWRVSGSDWTVVFVSSPSPPLVFDNWEHHRFDCSIYISWDECCGVDGVTYPRRIQNTSLFSITGSIDGFHLDAMMWKLSL